MVCIYGITFDHTTNYGSCLQAYALQTAVERITVLNERCSYRLIPLQTLLETPPANFAGRIKRIVYWYYRKQFEEFENSYNDPKYAGFYVEDLFWCYEIDYFD